MHTHTLSHTHNEVVRREKNSCRSTLSVLPQSHASQTIYPQPMNKRKKGHTLTPCFTGQLCATNPDRQRNFLTVFKNVLCQPTCSQRISVNSGTPEHDCGNEDNTLARSRSTSPLAQGLSRDQEEKLRVSHIEGHNAHFSGSNVSDQGSTVGLSLHQKM